MEAVATRIGLTNALRRAYPVNDVVEAVAARRALAAGMRAHRPRALVISTTTAALLIGDPGVPFAVWLDSPARLNRPGVAERASARARAPATRPGPCAPAPQPRDGGGAPARRGADRSWSRRRSRPRPRRVRRPRALRGRLHARSEGQGPGAAVRGVGAGRAARRAPADRRHPARARPGRSWPGGARRCRRGPSWSGCCPSPSSATCWPGRTRSSAPRRGRTSGSRRSRRSTAAPCWSARRPAGRSRRSRSPARWPRSSWPRPRLPHRSRDALRGGVRRVRRTPLATYRAAARAALEPYRPEASVARLRDEVLPALLGE